MAVHDQKKSVCSGLQHIHKNRALPVIGVVSGDQSGHHFWNKTAASIQTSSHTCNTQVMDHQKKVGIQKMAGYISIRFVLSCGSKEEIIR